MRIRIPTLRRGVVCALFLALLAALPLASSAQNTYTLPLVLPAGGAGLEGFIRIVNDTIDDDGVQQGGTVQIHGFDDTGRRFGPVALSIGARAIIGLNSRDLEQGNAAKGLQGGLGDGRGNWRLLLSTDLNIHPLAYIRTADGFLTAMHDVAPTVGHVHTVGFFNPASNTRQVSRLRLINEGTTAAEVSITGRDDAGNVPSEQVRLTLPAGAARLLTAREIESGGEGLDGRLGDGEGKWYLTVTADVEITVMSLLTSPTGHLSNLSAMPLHSSTGPGPDPRDPGGPRDHGNTPATATVVGVNSTTTGTIDPRGDRDYFRIEIPRAGQLTVSTTGGTDTYGTLFRGSSRVATNDDGGTSANFRITREVQAGTWYVEVRGFRTTTTGSYTLQVQFQIDDHGDTRTTATRVATPSVTAGNLEVARDLDYFRFEVPSIGRLRVYSTGNTDTVGTLYRGNTRVTSNDDGGSGLNFQINRTQTEAGTYYVAVSGYNSPTRGYSTGGYRFVVEFTPDRIVRGDDHGDTCATATRVATPSVTAGNLEVARDLDYFRFEVPSTGQLRVYSTGNTDTVGTLYRGNTRVTSNDDGGSGTNFRINRTQAEAGTYCVAVSGFSNSRTGRYSFVVEFDGFTGRWGAFASFHGRNCSSYGTGHVTDQSSQSAARAGALANCERYRNAVGGSNPGACHVHPVFTRCSAVAYGQSGGNCVWSSANGPTQAATEAAAIALCNAHPSGENCRIPTFSNGQRPSACNNVARSASRHGTIRFPEETHDSDRSISESPPVPYKGK